MVVSAFGSLVYAGITWRWKTTKAELPTWRRVVTNLGFLAVSAQAILFAASWTGIGRDYVLFSQWARWVLPTFLVALPCAIAAKGPSRWWLLLSSILLFVTCFFIVLSA